MIHAFASISRINLSSPNLWFFHLCRRLFAMIRVPYSIQHQSLGTSREEDGSQAKGWKLPTSRTNRAPVTSCHIHSLGWDFAHHPRRKVGFSLGCPVLVCHLKCLKQFFFCFNIFSLSTALHTAGHWLPKHFRFSPERLQSTASSRLQSWTENIGCTNGRTHHELASSPRGS